MEVRKPGYYWAKLVGEWIIVEYEFNAWSFMASEETTIKDSFFDEIDENRIVRPEPYSEIKRKNNDKLIYGQSFEILKEGKVYTIIRYKSGN